MIRSVKVKDSGSRWYVEYRELDIETNTWQRRREYGNVNREKDLVKRRELIQDLCTEVMSSIVRRNTSIRNGESDLQKYIVNYTADKKNTLRGTSIKNITLTLRYFYDFMKANGYHLLPLHAIRKNHIHEFRIYLSSITGARSVNGHMGLLKSFFNYYIDNYDDILYKNPCSGFKKLPTVTETHVAYTDDQVDKCIAYMQRHDPYLLFYTMFIGLAFVRCEEVRHLKISDIDFKKKTITIWAGYSKTRSRLVKPVMDIFFKQLVREELFHYPPNFYIFSEQRRPGEKPVGKNYFRKRFKRLKEDLGLTKNHTIYGFRHTFVCQLLENGAKWHKIMQFTGHLTMEAFSHYARSIHTRPSEDLSRFIRTKFT